MTTTEEKTGVCPLGHHGTFSQSEFHEIYTPEQLVEAQHKGFGFYGGRAVHAKGIVLEGTFTPDPQASTLTTARHLQKESSNILVRFSNFTSLLDIADNLKDANARGFAIKFIGRDGFTTDIVAHSFNGFPVKNTDDFRDFLMALAASGPDVPKPTPVDQYLDTHPATKTFANTQKNPASYVTMKYFAANSFKFTNADSISTYVRYQFIPQEGEHLLTDEQMASKSPSYLQDDIKARTAAKPVKFDMYAQLAGQNDVIDDPSTAWPDTREKVLLGVLEINKVSSNTPEQDKALIFIPNNVPEGIQTADPMLDFRAKAYPISQKGRQGMVD
jgi:catalase